MYLSFGSFTIIIIVLLKLLNSEGDIFTSVAIHRTHKRYLWEFGRSWKVIT